MKPRQWLKRRSEGPGPIRDAFDGRDEFDCPIPIRRPERTVKISTYRFAVTVAAICGLLLGLLLRGC